MNVTVVGAGVIGLACAYELTELGHEVTVVDAGAAGAAASAGNAGWVVPFLSTPRAAPGAVRDALKSFTSTEGPARMRPHLDSGFTGFVPRFLLASGKHRSAARTAALQTLAGRAVESFDALTSRGLEFEQHADGLGVVFKDAANLAHYEQMVVAKMRTLGYPGRVEIHRGTDVSGFDPAISSTVAGVIHLVDERHVRPESLTQALAKAIVDRGGQVIEHEAVTGIRKQDRWFVSTAYGRVLESDQVLVAAGYRSRTLLKPLGVSLPLEAAKGTSMTARGTGTTPTHPLKLYEHMVACSPFNGSVRLSGTFDIGRRDLALSRKRLDMVVRQGLTYLADWRPTDVEIEWVGQRPTSSDDTPIIGPIPGQHGLYVATGHGTLGVTLGPVTGRLVAQEMALDRPCVELEAFRPTRFSNHRINRPR